MRSNALRRFVAGALGGAAILLVALSATTVTHAAEEDVAAGPEETGWTFEIAPYLWLPEMHGTLSTRRTSAPIDVDLGKVFDLIFDGELLAGGLHLGAQWERFSLFVDGFGGGAQPSSQTERGKADLTLNFAFIEFGPAYRVLDLPIPKPNGRSIQVDALVGGRFMYFYNSIGFQGTRGRVNFSSDSTTTWVDPFVGGRWRVPLIGELDMIFRGDIGGFDAGSKLAWNLIGGFQYGLPWRMGESRVSLVAAYKAFDFDYEGSGERQGRLALNLRGPLLGAAFNF